MPTTENSPSRSFNRRSMLKKCGAVGVVGVTGVVASGPASASHTRELTVEGYRGSSDYYFVVPTVEASGNLEDSDTITDLDNGLTAVDGYVDEGFKDVYWVEGPIYEARASVWGTGSYSECRFYFTGDFEHTGFDRLKFSGSSTDGGEYQVNIHDGSISKYAKCETCDQVQAPDCISTGGGGCRGHIFDDEDIYSKSTDMLRDFDLEPNQGQTITMEHYG